MTAFKVEIWKQAKDGSHVKIEEEEKFSLAGEGGKKGTRGAESSSRGEKKKNDLNRIKCFSCHQFGHYATSAQTGRRGPRRTMYLVLQR